MAVLNKIRQRSVFLIIIIALALFSFVLADVIRNGGMVSQKSQNTIATVNGEDIERQQFAMQVEALQRNLGPNASTLQAVERVWDMNLRKLLLEGQFDELGIRVGEAQVKALLREQLANNPNFSDQAGNFDANKLQQYVATLKATSPEAFQQWVDFENSVAESARQNIYFDMVKAGIGATLLEGEQIYRQSNNSFDLEFVQIPYSSIPDAEVEVSKEEIKAYMQEHPESFQTEASVDIQFVHFVEEASLEDQNQIKEELSALLEDRVEYNPVTEENDTVPGFGGTENFEAFVNENSDATFVDRFLFKNQLPSEYADELFNLGEGEVFGPYKEGGAWKLTRMVELKQMPDSAKARHILVSYQGTPIGAALARTKEEAKDLADSIAAVVQNDTLQFAALAAQYSADASNKETAGELGWFAPGTFVPPFNEYVFSNDPGDIGVVESDFGYHVIEIQDQTEPQKAVKLATISREIEPSEKSLNDLFTNVTKFEIAAGNGEFIDVAKENNLEVRPVKDIKVLEENIPGIGAQRRIVQWAFEEDTEVGAIERFDINSGYVVAQVTAKNAEGLKSVEAASATVIPILQKQKKAEIIKSNINADTLEEIAGNQGVEVNTASAVNLANPVLPGAGRESKVVGVASVLEEGQTSEPIVGEEGVYVVELLQKNEATELNSYRSFAAKETAERRSSINTKVFSALKETAEIEDNRSRFY